MEQRRGLTNAACILPMLRVRENTAGCLDVVPAFDLAPWQSTEAWWRDVLANPRPRSRFAARGFTSKYDDYKGRTSYTLADETKDTIEIACRKCPRAARFLTAELTACYGRDHNMPGLLLSLAADCPRVGDRWDACGAYYVDPIGGRRRSGK